jgi:hypothetical protein
MTRSAEEKTMLGFVRLPPLYWILLAGMPLPSSMETIDKGEIDENNSGRVD